MPPEVEPEQPHTNDPTMRMAMLKAGHRLVSVVAKPVVVVMEHIWKAATRKASPKEVQVLVINRSAAMHIVPTKTKPRNTRTILVLNRFLRLLPLGHKVEKIKLKLMPANSMDTMRMASIAGLSKAATLMFLVLKPQVLHADMAWVTASNHVIPARCKQ